MPDTKSELNDIILNKSTSSFNGFKKVLLAVASFAVLLIIVVVVMSSINDNKTDLSKTILPPEPKSNTERKSELFKAVEISQESNNAELKRLENIANEIKQQTLQSTIKPEKVDEKVVVNNNNIVTIDDPYSPKITPKIVKTKEVKKVIKDKKTVKTAVKTPVQDKKGNWYVQVGSFARLKPHVKLIAKIKRLGFSFKRYKVHTNGKEMTKLLIGPYVTYKSAKKAKKRITAEIEPAAFIYQVVQ